MFALSIHFAIWYFVFVRPNNCPGPAIPQPPTSSTSTRRNTQGDFAYLPISKAKIDKDWLTGQNHPRLGSSSALNSLDSQETVAPSPRCLDNALQIAAKHDERETGGTGDEKDSTYNRSNQGLDDWSEHQAWTDWKNWSSSSQAGSKDHEGWQKNWTWDEYYDYKGWDRSSTWDDTQRIRRPTTVEQLTGNYRSGSPKAKRQKTEDVENSQGNQEKELKEAVEDPNELLQQAQELLKKAEDLEKARRAVEVAQAVLQDEFHMSGHLLVLSNRNMLGDNEAHGVEILNESGNSVVRRMNEYVALNTHRSKLRKDLQAQKRKHPEADELAQKIQKMVYEKGDPKAAQDAEEEEAKEEKEAKDAKEIEDIEVAAKKAKEKQEAKDAEEKEAEAKEAKEKQDAKDAEKKEVAAKKAKEQQEAKDAEEKEAATKKAKEQQEAKDAEEKEVAAKKAKDEKKEGQDAEEKEVAAKKAKEQQEAKDAKEKEDAAKKAKEKQEAKDAKEKEVAAKKAKDEKKEGQDAKEKEVAAKKAKDEKKEGQDAKAEATEAAAADFEKELEAKVDEEEAKQEAEKMSKRKKANHARYMRFFRSVTSVVLNLQGQIQLYVFNELYCLFPQSRMWVNSWDVEVEQQRRKKSNEWEGKRLEVQVLAEFMTK